MKKFVLLASLLALLAGSAFAAAPAPEPVNQAVAANIARLSEQRLLLMDLPQSFLKRIKTSLQSPILHKAIVILVADAAIAPLCQQVADYIIRPNDHIIKLDLDVLAEKALNAALTSLAPSKLSSTTINTAMHTTQIAPTHVHAIAKDLEEFDRTLATNPSFTPSDPCSPALKFIASLVGLYTAGCLAKLLVLWTRTDGQRAPKLIILVAETAALGATLALFQRIPATLTLIRSFFAEKNTGPLPPSIFTATLYSAPPLIIQRAALTAAMNRSTGLRIILPLLIQSYFLGSTIVNFVHHPDAATVIILPLQSLAFIKCLNSVNASIHHHFAQGGRPGREQLREAATRAAAAITRPLSRWFRAAKNFFSMEPEYVNPADILLN